jgi:CMP-N,N'-diacetyllegionaminic acid synthase
MLKLGGKPLILHTVDLARELFRDDQICVSTDDPIIIEIVEKSGLKISFTRPAELATDSASSRSVLLHASMFYNEVLNYKHNTIILLQPTSPLRKIEHVQECINEYDKKYDMIVTVKKAKGNPYLVLNEEDDKGFLKKSIKIHKSNNTGSSNVWEINGAVYVINLKSLLKNEISSFKRVKKVEMEEIYSIDIDTIVDFKLCELMINEGLV